MITPAFAQGLGGGSGDLVLQLVPFLLIFVIMYFLIIRPQQRRVKEHQELVRNVRRGDTIVTTGGIVGKVTKATDDPLANLPTQPLGQMIHPTGIQIEIEADLHFFDTHMHFAHKIAQARRVRFLPLYRFARRVYRRAKRKHADWRRPV